MIADRNKDTDTDGTETDVFGMWESFDVMKCELSTIQMTCYQWVMAEDEAAKADVYGYRQWSDGDDVKFIWFDGRYFTTTYVAEDEAVISGAANVDDP